MAYILQPEESISMLYVLYQSQIVETGKRATELIQRIEPLAQSIQANLYNLATKANFLAIKTGLLNNDGNCDYDCGQDIYGLLFLTCFGSLALTAGVFYLADKFKKNK